MKADGYFIYVCAFCFLLPESGVKQIAENTVSKEQKIQYRSVDLSSNYDDVAKALADLETSVGEIYALINCAGLAICGTVAGNCAH